MNKKILVFFAVLILSIVLRIYKVDKFPVSLYWDEVAIGYNAYSVLTTGKDEYGKFLPLSFESYQDSKIPGYIYSTVFSELFFGPSELGVRLPSVIFGIGATIIIFFISRELFFKSKFRNLISFLSSFILAISPWALQFSRAAFEANGGLFFALMGIYFLLYWIRTQKRLIWAALSIVISLYFYYQQRIFFPLFLFVIFFVAFPQIIVKWKSVLLNSIISLVLILPILFVSFSSSSRLDYVSVFKDQEIIKPAAKARLDEGNSFTAKLVHNRYLTIGITISNNYWKHFSPQFLFFEGDSNQRHSVLGVGELYLWFLPFLIIGLIYLFVNKDPARKIIISWLAIAPLAAAISIPTPHALRSLLLLPALVIVSSYGIIVTFVYLKNKLSKKLLIVAKSFLVLTLSIFIFQYLHLYYVHEKTRSLGWADGYKGLYSYLSEVEGQYKYIYVTGYYWRPYIFMLFYNKYSPSLHQKNPVNNRIGKYYFGFADYDKENPRYNFNDISFAELKKIPNVLFALSPTEVRDFDQIVKTIYSASGEPVFVLVKNNL